MPRSFNGTTDDIGFGSDASIDDIFAASPFTGTIACRFIRAATGFQALVSKGDDSTAGWSLFFRGAGASHTLAFHRRGTANSGKWQTTTQFSGTGTEFHFIMSYDGTLTTNDPTMYLNGVAETVNEFATPTTAPTSDAAENMQFGEQIAASPAPLNGILYNVAVSKTIWTAQQRLNHANWFYPGGAQLILQPLYTDKLTNEGTGVATGTAAGTTMVGSAKVQRAGGMMMMGCGL